MIELRRIESGTADVEPLQALHVRYVQDLGTKINRVLKMVRPV